VKRLVVGSAWVLLLFAGVMRGQGVAAPAAQAADVPAAGQDGGGAAARSGEAAVEGLTRKDADTVALALPGGRELLLHDFEFPGQAVRTGKLHFRQVAPGVVEITCVAYTVGEWRFHVHDAGNYYGLGERADGLNRAHTMVKTGMMAGALGAASGKPMPFFMSTSGYGMWVDATSEATFDMNGSSADDIVVTVPADRLRIVLFPGGDFASILERFTRVMGPAMLPPYWAFAPWKVGAPGQTQAQVLGDAERLRELNLPASVLLLDEPWGGGKGYSFDAKRFDDAAAMSKQVHDSGYKLVVGVSPWVERPNPDPAGGSADDLYYVRTQDGPAYVRAGVKRESAVDLTSSISRAWWQGQLRDAMKAGVDGFALEDTAGEFSGAARFADATDVRAMRNRYGMLAVGATEDLVDKDLKSDGVVLTEHATQGAGGAGFLLAGTHKASFSPEVGLPTLLNEALSAGLSGMPLWTAEMGSGTADDAAFSRWAELAAFSPVMLTTRGPWEFGDAAFEVYRKYSTLHMSLFPYRYAAALEAAKTGMPVMRALMLAFPNDERARVTTNEYMFGPDLLVAPVLDESLQRAVYLPAGLWVNYWTGGQVEGGKTLMVDAPLDVIPVYVRSGAVLAKILDAQTLVTAKESGNASLRTLDGRRVFELVGPSAEGERVMTDFEGRKVVRSGTTLTLSGGAAARVIVRWQYLPVHSVTVNGAGVSVQTGKDGPFVEFDYSDKCVVGWN